MLKIIIIIKNSNGREKNLFKYVYKNLKKTINGHIAKYSNGKSEIYTY